MEQTKKKTNKTSIMLKIQGYLQASRMEGGIVAAIFLLLGEWYHLKAFPHFESFLAIISIITIVNSGSWFNYIFDRELDKFADKDIDFFKIISAKEMFVTSAILSIISLIMLYYVSFLSLILGLVSFFVFFIYASPPFRLKTKPVLDIICNALGFGFLPFLIGFSLTKNNLEIEIIIQTAIVSMPVISYYLFIGIFDIESDKSYGIKNSCTLLGIKSTKLLGVLVFFVSVILSFFYFQIASVYPISILVISPMVASIVFTKKITYLRVLVSTLFLIWTAIVLFLMFVLSFSIFPFFFLLLIIIFSIMTIYTYLKL